MSLATRIAAAFALSLLLLGACGKKGDLRPPAGYGEDKPGAEETDAPAAALAASEDGGQNDTDGAGDAEDDSDTETDTEADTESDAAADPED